MVNYVQFTDRKREAGFTLVELAVVMIIIGLLIGGVLKGQELIANAQVAATVAQVKAFDAATTTFRDMFDGMPGDLANAGARLPNCAGGCIGVGALLGNRRVDGAAADPFAGAPSSEMIAFWWQLNAADLVSGIDPNRVGGGWGAQFPAAKIGGGFTAGFFPANGVTLLTNQTTGAVAANVRSGHYLALYNTLAGAGVPAPVDGVGYLTSNQAFRIDSKLDDGVPNSGSVLASGAATCALAGPPVVYNEAVPGSVCNLYVRFQN